MIYPIYSVRDLKGDFWSPRIEMNEAAARRSFSELILTEGSSMHLFPEDFEYYQIGFFDSVKGTIQSFELPQFLCRGNEVINV